MPVWTGPLEDPPLIGRGGSHHATLCERSSRSKRRGLDEHLPSSLGPLVDHALAGRGDRIQSYHLSRWWSAAWRMRRARRVRTWGMCMLTALDYARALVAETPWT